MLIFLSIRTNINKGGIMNILNRLQKHVEDIPNRLLYRFEEGEDKIDTLTFQELDNEAKSIANDLTQKYQKGDRALLLYPSGLEFITAFIGCLYAGLIAVPAYPPRKNQKLDRLKSIISNSNAKAILTTAKTVDIVKNSFENEPFLKDIPIIQTDKIEERGDNFIEIEISGEDIAFLQYTSGSTGDPKGVMVTHSNIMSNMEALHLLIGYTKQSRCVSWLPLFHDMGLMGGVLEPLYIGCEITLMSPVYFLQKPVRWLKAISKYQVDVSGAPNFAYELCLNSIKDSDLEGIDLSYWKSAANGAEPIYLETLERFSQRFEPYGFRDVTHYPCYGMAETTLIITGAEQEKKFNSLSLNSERLKEGVVIPSSKGQSIISCGKPTLDHKVIIDTKDGEDVGEILVKGSSVAKGYWNNEVKTKEVFGEYLKTGDLGFIYDDELFVCGRVKDLIIIRGQNYYPQDIEIVAYQSHEALIDMGCAVFSIERDGAERLVVVQEVKRTYLRKYNAQEIFSAICEAIGEEHELMVYDIVLIKPNRLLKTSSGKIQRYRNKEFYINGEFTPLATFLDKHEQINQTIMKKDLELLKKSMPSVQKELLRLWIADEVAQLCGIGRDEIVIEKSFVSFGIDSLKSIELQNRLSQILDIDTPLMWFYEYPTILEFSDKIFELIDDENLSRKKLLKPLVVDSRGLYEPFPLNDIQEAYLLGRDSSMVLGNTACFAYTELELDNIDLDRLERAWNRVIEYFPMLRTTIDVENMTQSITPKVPYFKIDREDLSDIEDTKTYLATRRDGCLNTILEPNHLPLFNMKAYILSDKTILHIYIDMLICDASSIGVMLNKLRKFYYDEPIEPLGVIFRDYMLYKERYKESYRYKKSLEYWTGRLETLPSAPQLLLSTAPEDITKPKFTRRHFSMDKKRWSAFQQNSIELGSTPTALLLACYAKVLALWSNNKHFCINLTLFDRLQVHKDINKIVGDFTSLNPLEVNVPSSKSFKEIIEDVKRQLFMDLEHKDIGGIQILREMRSLNRDVSMPVVFTSTLGLDSVDTKWLGESLYTISQTPQVWIDNQISEVDGELIVNWDAIEELFPARMLNNMFELYKKIVYRVTEDIELLENSKLYSFDRNYRLYNMTHESISLEPLPISFMEHLSQYANLDAIISDGKRISYQELHNGAVQIAQKIEELGIKADEHVAILLPKGWEQVVSVLACGYAGVAYLPLSISYPKNRIDYLIKEANIKMVLSSDSLFSNIDLEVIDVASFVDLGREMPHYLVKAHSDDLAYTIFTSGSTGTPKGVMITHANIANTIRDMNQRFELSSVDNFFALSELNFDLSVYDIYGALECGATVVIPTEKEKSEPSIWLDMIEKENITIWNSVPAFMQLLLSESDAKFDNLRLALLSGDFISTKLAKDILKANPKLQLISLGGATEASIWSIFYPITIESLQRLEKIPYGYPLDNQEIYIWDRGLQSVPCMVEGEIYIAGLGVAKGYFNDPEKTQNAFIEREGKIFYKTGDIGYFNPNGYVEIIGRIDNQVKIRGFRVELGEIEEQLISIEGIKQSVALVKNETIIAHISVAQKDVDISFVKEQLLLNLPEYMIPSTIKIWDALPLNINGKIDRKALAEVEVEIETSVEFVAPRDEIEEKLATIFKEVLNLDRVSIYDNFFELGGHSLLATQVVSKVRANLEVELSLRAIFTHATIDGLKSHILANHQIESQDSIVALKNRDKIELSYAQERLWFLDRFEEGNGTVYNMSALLLLEGELDKTALNHALTTVVNRHEILRTNFVLKGEKAVQQINSGDKFKIKEIILEDDEVTSHAQMALEQGFDLENDSLFEVILYTVDKNRHYLFVNMHHIISDGWSLGVLINEFTTLYQYNSLPPLKIQYGDYALWQKRALNQEVLDEKMEFWHRELQGVEPLNLPTTYSRPTVQSYRGDHIHFTIDSSITGLLNRLAKKQDVTLFMLLISSFGLLLERYSGQDDIVIGSPIANRGRVEIENLIGFFINILPIRVNMGDKSFSKLLDEVKERTLGVYEYQDIPYEKIVDALNLPRDTSRSPLFQVMFTLQNTDDIELSLPNLTIKDLKFENPVSKFDLSMELTEREGQLEGSLEYATDLFSRKFMEGMVEHFKILLSEIVKNSSKKLLEYNILSEKETHELVVELNATESIYPREKSVHRVFEEQVEKYPTKTALVYKDKSVTYEELNRKSNQLAHYLIEKGIKKGDIVVLFLDRSIEIIVGILGIIKAGGVYLPLDTSYPADRIEYITKDSNAFLVLNRQDIQSAIESSSITHNPQQNIKGDDLIYLIYTSGSTGNPKGVMVEHKGVNRLILGQNYIPFDENIVMLQTNSISFDVATFDIYGALLVGGTLVLYEESKLDLSVLNKSIKKYSINSMWLTSALFEQWVFALNEDLDSLKYLLAGGDIVNSYAVNQLHQKLPTVTIIDGYGPTENTTFTTTYRCNRENIYSDIPIGRPINNTTAYILDKNLNLVPKGVIGELYTGGDGVARGYLNKAELTDERFFDFRGDRVYKTGDLVKYREDGNIIYLGREDNQVKIRGFRVELGEIEQQILQIEGIKEAVVLEKDNRLIAYITFEKNYMITDNDIKSQLLVHLPEYMIPFAINSLSKMPVNPNGKVDRRALSKLEIKIESSKEFVAPKEYLEIELAKIFEELLDVDRVGLNDNFFELGGHSLLATQLVSKIRIELGLELSLKTLFGATTLKELVYILEETQKVENEMIIQSSKEIYEKLLDDSEDDEIEEFTL